MTIINSKSISLTFRGFDLSPSDVELIVGRASSSTGTKGKKTKPQVTTILPRSFVQFEIELPNNCCIDDMVPQLIVFLGGIDNICRARDQIQPEFLEIDITLPIKGSDEQDDGYFSLEVLRDINTLRATLGLSFLWKEGYSARVIEFLDSEQVES